MNLPVQPPFAPMEARLVREIPQGADWQFEPKWDGFRCLIFRDGPEVFLQSKSGQPLARYFPELTKGALELRPQRFVLDGEIVIPLEGRLSFDELLQRIHPATSRVQKLARERSAVFIAFDLLAGAEGEALFNQPLHERRVHLERFADAHLHSGLFRLSPATRDVAVAKRWFQSAGSDLDGIVAKRVDLEYHSGDRTGMQKVKPIRTAECVLGGFRYTPDRKSVASLLLGLFDDSGLLHHVGFCSGLKASERTPLARKLAPLIEPPGFTGHAPGGPSRWSTERSTQWEPLRPELVLEIEYDHFTGSRFRHGTKFVRWRPDKSPRQCQFDQVITGGHASYRLLKTEPPSSGAAVGSVQTR